jgi:hypothetical protein
MDRAAGWCARSAGGGHQAGGERSGHVGAADRAEPELSLSVMPSVDLVCASKDEPLPVCGPLIAPNAGRANGVTAESGHLAARRPPTRRPASESHRLLLVLAAGAVHDATRRPGRPNPSPISSRTSHSPPPPWHNRATPTRGTRISRPVGRPGRGRVSRDRCGHPDRVPGHHRGGVRCSRWLADVPAVWWRERRHHGVRDCPRPTRAAGCGWCGYLSVTDSARQAAA